MIILRSPHSLSPDLFQVNIDRLLGEARYKRNASYDEIPHEADCISAALFVINHSSVPNLNIPLCWIGNAPGRLVNQWNFELIETSTLKTGDLLFVKNKKATRLITHVLVAISADLFFHCSYKINGCEIVSTSSVLEKFQQPFSGEELLQYLDPRSNSAKQVAPS